MDYCNLTYLRSLKTNADRLRNWDNISTGDLYLNASLNREMERLFGVPVYQEHKNFLEKALHEPRFQQCSVREALDILHKEKNHTDTLPSSSLPQFNSTPNRASEFNQSSTNIRPPLYFVPKDTPKTKIQDPQQKSVAISIGGFSKKLYSDVCAKQLPDHHEKMGARSEYKLL